ncbi:hypothetical protein GDO78_017327 [Eleutherodactylus coqui]|uniref:Uncharacterized protein n=1 Tax=Eleutherodactylus coqui TaxID=57060 RepID=A0A8J6B8M2_ELECQ|nr:hypothetical protein GDO78_017327 [Eleutherodactylus coqui]
MWGTAETNGSVQQNESWMTPVAQVVQIVSGIEMEYL